MSDLRNSCKKEALMGGNLGREAKGDELEGGGCTPGHLRGEGHLESLHLVEVRAEKLETLFF